MAAGLLQNTLSNREAALKNPLSLAYVGDTVWDLMTRQRLLSGEAHVGTLHRLAVALVNAGAQSEALGRIEPALTEEEADILRRGKNAHAKHSTPKNQNAMDYSRATGLEALFGFLYLTGQHERICELFDIGVPIL